MTTPEMLAVMQRENENAVAAVGQVLPDMTVAVEKIAARMKEGGRLFYVGCGTSGRLGVLDAAECPPTFGIAPDRVIAVIAGGERAMRSAIEGSEDDGDAGKRAIAAYGLTETRIRSSVYPPQEARRLCCRQSRKRMPQDAIPWEYPPTQGSAFSRRRYSNYAGHRRGGRHRLNANESRHRAETDPEHDLDGRHDTPRICMPESYDKSETHEPETPGTHDPYYGGTPALQ